MEKRLRILIISAVVLMFALPSWAISTRVESVHPGYDVHDFTLTAQDANHWYSSGLDVVYVNGVRHFLVLWNTNSNWPALPVYEGNSIRLSLYDYNGNLVTDLATYTDALNTDGDPSNDIVMWPQSVKLSPDGSTIWVSYTGAKECGWPENISDWFCTIPWDHTLTIYGSGPLLMTPQFEFPGNWEMEWSTDANSPPEGQRGRPFVAGLIPPVGDYNHGVYLYKPGDPSPLQLVIEVGGNSAGFAFDNKGNLWCATYDFGLPNQMIYMWTAAQIHSALTANPSQVLTTEDATAEIQTPNNLGGNDVERDAVGNVYFSLNNGTTWIGEIVRVDNDGSPPWPSTTTTVARALNLYDWARNLAFDGPGNLSTPGRQEASNRLYLDMDQGSQGVTTPTVVGISAAGDAGGDGVPDGLDNCWQSANADQTDWDADGYGDECDSNPSTFNDYDGDGIADLRDWSWDTPDDQTLGFSEFSALINNWLCAPSEPDMDHDADGVVGFFEFQFLLDNWLQPQPLHPNWP